MQVGRCLLSMLAVMMVTVAVIFLLSATNRTAPKRQESECTTTTTTEAFSIAMQGEHTIDSDTEYRVVRNWTDTVDTAAYPQVSPRMLFQRLTMGVLDFAAGTFTVGVAGVYRVTHPQYVRGEEANGYTCAVVNDVGTACTLALDTAPNDMLFNLEVGDVVDIRMGWGSAPQVVTPTALRYATAVPERTYGLVWTMTKE